MATFAHCITSATPQPGSLTRAPATVRVSSPPELAGPTTAQSTEAGEWTALDWLDWHPKPPKPQSEGPWNPGILDFIIPFSHPGKAARCTTDHHGVLTRYVRFASLFSRPLLDLNLEPSPTASISRPLPPLPTLESPSSPLSCASSLVNPPRGPTTRLHGCLRGYKSTTLSSPTGASHRHAITPCAC